MSNALDEHQKTYLVAVMAFPKVDQISPAAWRVLSVDLVNVLLPELSVAGVLSRFVTQYLPGTDRVVQFKTTVEYYESPVPVVEPILKNEQEVREYLVRQLHAHLAKYVRPFLQGKEVLIQPWPPHFEYHPRLEIRLNRNEDGTLRQHWEIPQQTAAAYTLKDMRRKIDSIIFTFLKDSDTLRYLNVCPVCGTVFMRQRLGKPRKFCSVSCRAKGIPSAKKRAEYTRNQRRKAKERENSIAREILDKTHSAIDRINLLRQAFPRKSLQQCWNVLKRVERIEHPIKEV